MKFNNNLTINYYYNLQALNFELYDFMQREGK